MGNDPIIRRMTVDDYDDVIALWRSAGLGHRPAGRDTRERMSRDLENPESVFLVADLEGRVVGSVFATHDGRKGWINRLAVSIDMRRKGLACLLIREAESRLEEMGIGMVCALIEDWNTASRQLFEGEGYDLQEKVLYYTKKQHPEF